VCDGIGKGFSVHEIVWDTTTKAFVPASLNFIESKHFEVSWYDGRTIWLRDSAVQAPGTDQANPGFRGLAPHKFLVHRHPVKSGVITRSGLTRAVAWVWMYANYTQRDWAVFTQAYGMPIRLGRYGPEASQSDKQVLWRAVSSIAGDVAAIIPKSMEIEFVTGSDRSRGHELYNQRGDWLNFEVSKLVLGSTASTDAIRGSRASAVEHRQVEKDAERYDAGKLAATFTRQLAATLIALNFGPQDAYPVIGIGQPDATELKDVIAAVADLGPLGLKVKAEEIRDRLQLSEPQPDDEVVGGTPPAPVPTDPIVHPAVALPSDSGEGDGSEQARGDLLRGLMLEHSAAFDTDVLEPLTRRLGEDAAGALAGMTKPIREAFEAAHDMRDLATRIAGLVLSPDDFAEAMARGLALAQLIGQAALLDELGVRTSAHDGLTAEERDALDDEDFAVPGKRRLPIKDAKHVRLAWDMLDRTGGLTPGERREARARILAKAKTLGVNTSGWSR
jgi:phage gp29-like protein